MQEKTSSCRLAPSIVTWLQGGSDFTVFLSKGLYVPVPL